MKNLLMGLIFWSILLLTMLALFAIAEFLASVITIDFVMAIVYIAIGFGLAYILKN